MCVCLCVCVLSEGHRPVCVCVCVFSLRQTGQCTGHELKSEGEVTTGTIKEKSSSLCENAAMWSYFHRGVGERNK